MFAATQTLDDASGDDVTYVLVKQGDIGTTRLDSSTSLAYPGQMQIKHSVSGSNGNASDRHLVQFSRTLAGTGGAKTLVANFTLNVPRDSVITNQIVYDLVANLLDFITAGDIATMTTTNVLALLRGES